MRLCTCAASLPNTHCRFYLLSGMRCGYPTVLTDENDQISTMKLEETVIFSQFSQSICYAFWWDVMPRGGGNRNVLWEGLHIALLWRSSTVDIGIQKKQQKINRKSLTWDGKEGKRELGTFKQTFPPLHCVHCVFIVRTIDDIPEITFHMGNTICTSPLWLKCLHRADGSP